MTFKKGCVSSETRARAGVAGPERKLHPQGRVRDAVIYEAAVRYNFNDLAPAARRAPLRPTIREWRKHKE